jgi:hypothetical protein
VAAAETPLVAKGEWPSSGLGSGSSLIVALGTADSQPLTLKSGEARKSDNGLGSVLPPDSDNPSGDSSKLSNAIGSAGPFAGALPALDSKAGNASSSYERPNEAGSRSKGKSPGG